MSDIKIGVVVSGEKTFKLIKVYEDDLYDKLFNHRR